MGRQRDIVLGLELDGLAESPSSLFAGCLASLVRTDEWDGEASLRGVGESVGKMDEEK